MAGGCTFYLWLDHLVVRCLVPLALWILISGLDDLFIALVSLKARRDPFPWPSAGELERGEQRRIAILVPLWHEHRVIGQMLERNLASIDYSSFTVFVGVYPNDTQTMRAVSEAAARDPRIQLAEVPHDGPTSKGDCLNWIYRRMLDFEALRGVRFQVVITHDAEDLIHPESLRLINWFSRDYQMIQIPVLALPTRVREFTHGLYCDEFAEYQSKDIPVRRRLGGFLPGNGVGTGFDRDALERLAATRHGRIFDPDCLTEDYENGFRLHEMGCRQLFVPLRFGGAGLMATREYFPRHFRAAIRQRSRWVAGISLQGWELHGWRVPAGQLYWLWRDRKGLVGNLLSPGANAIFVYGLFERQLWMAMPEWVALVCASTFVVSVLHIVMRVAASRRIYGARFAAFVPLRMLYGNLINWLATAAAFHQFFRARMNRERLPWRKTEHVYLDHHAPALGMARIGDVLVRIQAAASAAVEQAAADKPESLRLGEYLVYLKVVTEENLYRALSVQSGIPLGAPPVSEVNRNVTRALPLEVARRWKVLPYRVHLGQLHLMTTELPSEAMTRALASHSTLELRFRLVRPGDYNRLAWEYFEQGELNYLAGESACPTGSSVGNIK